MSRAIPTVAKYMTSTPHTIGLDQPLSTAHEMMRVHHIRHLPVLKGARLVGVLSDRDLHLVESFRDVDPNKVTVEEAMSPEPFCVSPETPLDEVVREMAQHKYGAAIVVDHNHVVGVLTTVDVCRALHDVLHGKLAK